jgi:ribonuclease Z
MMRSLQEAFKFDIHIRRDVDEKYSGEGIKVVATDIREGVVYEANGVKVTAFLVDHGPVKPAFGYRVDYRGHSVVLSGDTKPSDNLVKFSQGTDLLLHEAGSPKQDPPLTGRTLIIANHHTDGLEAGRIFQRVQPKLAVFTHYNVQPAPTLALVRQNYAGPVEFGKDQMTIDVGDTVKVHEFVPPGK